MFVFQTDFVYNNTATEKFFKNSRRSQAGGNGYNRPVVNAREVRCQVFRRANPPGFF